MESKRMKLQSNNDEKNCKLQFTEQNESKSDHL